MVAFGGGESPHLPRHHGFRSCSRTTFFSPRNSNSPDESSTYPYFVNDTTIFDGLILYVLPIGCRGEQTPSLRNVSIAKVLVTGEAEDS